MSNKIDKRFGARPDTTMERFQKYHQIDEETGCWNWLGYINKSGYGMFAQGQGRWGLAHRWTYKTFKGQLIDGLVMDHLCRNRKCVNPEHLEQVTMRENTIRGIAGQHMREKSLLQTHCINGHEFTTDNTRIVNGAYGKARVCKICSNHRAKIHKRRKRVGVLFRENADQIIFYGEVI